MATIHAVIIDDTELGLKVLSSLLEMTQASHTTIQDPRKASTVLRNLPQVDVIFLDLEMPYLSGPDMLKLIKQDLGLNAPVIAYSVHTSEIQQVREMGFDGFLGKPVNMNDFPKHLQNILNGIPVWVAG
ncbi:MAG: response regulator [Anaerolinea sp.]|nr:response regulator [Anaerolinea sp.]MCC6973925.1 response regulator [Anaerolineae bacterium]CAG1012423.1 Polar-differentiation response regulator DivK [Anaerolineae bacterium]